MPKTLMIKKDPKKLRLLLVEKSRRLREEYFREEKTYWSEYRRYEKMIEEASRLNRESARELTVGFWIFKTRMYSDKKIDEMSDSQVRACLLMNGLRPQHGPFLSSLGPPPVDRSKRVDDQILELEKLAREPDSELYIQMDMDE